MKNVKVKKQKQTIKEIPTLSGKEANRFAKDMLEREKQEMHHNYPESKEDWDNCTQVMPEGQFKAGNNKEYILKFVNPQITIQEDSKEDFKALMEWDEEKFLSHVFVRLKNLDNQQETKSDSSNSVKRFSSKGSDSSLADKKLEDEILSCKTCNVTKDRLFSYPLNSKDFLTFENLCLNHKIKVVRQEARKELIEEFEKINNKYCIDINIDEFDVKEYPKLFTLVQKINENNRLLKQEIQELKGKENDNT